MSTLNLEARQHLFEGQGGVALWVAGFDTIYAVMDVDFDRASGLHSIPARWGRATSRWIAKALHSITFLCFLVAGLSADLGPSYLAGAALAGVILLIQHGTNRAGDPAKIEGSFLTTNASVSALLLIATLLGVS